MALSRVSILCCLLLAWAPAATLATGAIDHQATQENIQETICVPGYTKSVRPPVSYTNKIKLRLMWEQGIDPTLADRYELDHLIPLALGGHPRKLENLILQPWEGHDGAKRKDRLEVKLQCLVCTGQVELEQAQRDISENWQTAYRRYAQVKCRR